MKVDTTQGSDACSCNVQPFLSSTSQERDVLALKADLSAGGRKLGTCPQPRRSAMY